VLSTERSVSRFADVSDGRVAKTRASSFPSYRGSAPTERNCFFVTGSSPRNQTVGLVPVLMNHEEEGALRVVLDARKKKPTIARKKKP